MRTLIFRLNRGIPGSGTADGIRRRRSPTASPSSTSTAKRSAPLAPSSAPSPRDRVTSALCFIFPGWFLNDVFPVDSARTRSSHHHPAEAHPSTVVTPAFTGSARTWGPSARRHHSAPAGPGAQCCCCHCRRPRRRSTSASSACSSTRRPASASPSCSCGKCSW